MCLSPCTEVQCAGTPLGIRRKMGRTPVNLGPERVRNLSLDGDRHCPSTQQGCGAHGWDSESRGHLARKPLALLIQQVFLVWIPCHVLQVNQT